MSKLDHVQQDLMNLMVHQLEDFALVLLDQDGVIISWNRGAELLTGYLKEDVIGVNASTFIGDFTSKTKTVVDSLSEAREHNVSHHTGWRIKKDTTAFWADIQISPLKNEKNDILGYSAVIRDLTYTKEKEVENKELFQKIHNKNKELAEFNYMISHDLQEPLRTIRSFIGILDSKYSKNMDDKVSRITQTIYRASERMNDMLLALLNHSRIGRQTKKIDVNLNILCQDLLADLSNLIEKSKAKIYIQEDLPTVTANKIDIDLLLQNLISNSIKFSRPDTIPEIIISHRDIDKFHEFSVKDNGIGISEKHIDRIFTIFQRLHNRDMYQGTGIGLAHCKKIIELHEGNIWATSEEGVGSTFYFTLPKKTT